MKHVIRINIAVETEGQPFASLAQVRIEQTTDDQVTGEALARKLVTDLDYARRLIARQLAKPPK